jgi:hypothetical protein
VPGIAGKGDPEPENMVVHFQQFFRLQAEVARVSAKTAKKGSFFMILLL